MAYNVYPEYEFFTGVKILLSVDGDDKKTFSISKLGEHLQSLTIKEGTVGNGPQLQVPDIGGDISSGTVRLYDEDNALFLALIASKTPNGQQLLNKMDITINTYTGSRQYKNCRINKWNCDFNGGVPIISLEWQSLGGDSSPAFADSAKNTFDSVEAKRLLMDEGVTNFGDFITKVKRIFTDTLKFQYANDKVVNQSSLQNIGSHGEIKFFSGGVLTSGKIEIPKVYMQPNGNSDGLVYRMKLQASENSDSTSFLAGIMNEICSVARVPVSEGDNKQSSTGENLYIQWKFLEGDIVFIYTYKDTGSIAIPQPLGTAEILEGSVFIYNSSFPQGGSYKTPQGMKRAFSIDSISTSFDFSQIIIANLKDQNNASCPNGNMVITSRGSMMIPQSLPSEVADNIKKLENFNLSQNFTVRMTVYNFIHFYVLGETPVHLIVFDHLGNIHPITGRMRVTGYQYEIGSEGVVKADVTLQPLFSETNSGFSSNDTYYSPNDNTPIPVTTTQPQYTEGKADIEIDASLDYSPANDAKEPPSFLGIKVKTIPNAQYQQGKDKFKKPPRWIVVHYTAMNGCSAEKCTKNFASTTRKVSTHFFCDSKNVYSVVDEEHPAWHCGNGKTKQPNPDKTVTNESIYNLTKNTDDDLSYYKSELWRFDLPSHNHEIWKACKGVSLPEGNPYIKGDFTNGNDNSFGVDLCCLKRGTDKRKDVDATDWYFHPDTIENCAKVVAYLCYKWDIPVTRVMRHADVQGKCCPRPFVSAPTDHNFDNEWKWKRLYYKNTLQPALPIDPYPDPPQPSTNQDVTYSYDPRIHILDLEENVGNPKDRESFLGKVAGYIEVLRQQNYPYAYRER